MDLPLYTEEISGASLSIGSDYETTPEDEVEDLYRLLKRVKTEMPNLEGVSVGAILSSYQRVRVEHVCSRLGLVSLAYLWQRDQSSLLQEMVHLGKLVAVLVKVAAMGLKKTHLGKTLGEMQETLEDLNSKYDVHVCGEGGEYETMTLDCPLFKKRIVLYVNCINGNRDTVELVLHSDDDFAPVAYLHIKEAHLESKDQHGMDSELIASLKNANEQTVPPFDLEKYLGDLSLYSSGVSSPSTDQTSIHEVGRPLVRESIMYIPGLTSPESGTVGEEARQVFEILRGLIVSF
jgi:diphthine-ammonia ligase